MPTISDSPAAPESFPDGPYPDEAPEANLDYGYEPSEEDRRWWADESDRLEARAAARTRPDDWAWGADADLYETRGMWGHDSQGEAPR